MIKLLVVFSTMIASVVSAQTVDVCVAVDKASLARVGDDFVSYYGLQKDETSDQLIARKLAEYMKSIIVIAEQNAASKTAATAADTIIPVPKAVVDSVAVVVKP